LDLNVNDAKAFSAAILENIDVPKHFVLTSYAHKYISWISAWNIERLFSLLIRSLWLIHP